MKKVQFAITGAYVAMAFFGLALDAFAKIAH